MKPGHYRQQPYVCPGSWTESIRLSAAIFLAILMLFFFIWGCITSVESTKMGRVWKDRALPIVAIMVPLLYVGFIFRKKD